MYFFNLYSYLYILGHCVSLDLLNRMRRMNFKISHILQWPPLQRLQKFAKQNNNVLNIIPDYSLKE